MSEGPAEAAAAVPALEVAATADDEFGPSNPRLRATLLTMEVTTEWAASDGNCDNTELLNDDDEELDMLKEGVDEYIISASIPAH